RIENLAPARAEILRHGRLAVNAGTANGHVDIVIYQIGPWDIFYVLHGDVDPLSPVVVRPNIEKNMEQWMRGAAGHGSHELSPLFNHRPIEPEICGKGGGQGGDVIDPADCKTYGSGRHGRIRKSRCIERGRTDGIIAI